MARRERGEENGPCAGDARCALRQEAEEWRVRTLLLWLAIANAAFVPLNIVSYIFNEPSLKYIFSAVFSIFAAIVCAVARDKLTSPWSDAPDAHNGR